jgi:hypothetical protein
MGPWQGWLTGETTHLPLSAPNNAISTNELTLQRETIGRIPLCKGEYRKPDDCINAIAQHPSTTFSARGIVCRRDDSILRCCCILV